MANKAKKMNKYVIHDNDGNIVSCGISSDLIDHRLSSDHTQVWMDFPSDIENYSFDIASNSIVPLNQNVIDARETSEAWDLLRSIRDSLLASTDWTQASDAPVDKTEWATYRQALRDLPANTTDPSNPTWPTKPS